MTPRDLDVVLEAFSPVQAQFKVNRCVDNSAGVQLLPDTNPADKHMGQSLKNKIIKLTVVPVVLIVEMEASLKIVAVERSGHSLQENHASKGRQSGRRGLNLGGKNGPSGRASASRGDGEARDGVGLQVDVLPEEISAQGRPTARGADI